MYREPNNTDKKPVTQPSLCSEICKKLCLRSRKSRGEGNDSSSPVTGQEKGKTDDSAKNNKDKKKATDKNEIKDALKNLRRTTPYLPKALKSPYAYEKGKKSCEICNVDKETYKSIIKSIKVIELIVDDVINKEQKEMLDKEEEEEASETVSTKGEKKLSIQFEIYCQKDIDHNLKCVLVKLQKTIGDTLLQVCYCKAKKNQDDKKCKKYDVSVNVLEQLKYEYTNLTNSIIRLFKTPPPKQKTSPEVCVACVKEEVTDCTKMLEDMLKNGRNLKVSMRNDDAGKGKCCSRTYPHVHALVQERHVVLKFELPFEVVHPSQDHGKSKDREDNVKNERPAYDEWPEDFAPESTDDEHPKEDKRNSTSISNKSVNSLKNASIASNSLGKEQAPETESLTGSIPRGSKGSKSRSSVHSSPSALESSGSKTKDHESLSSGKYCGCNFNEVYDKLKVEPNENKDNSQIPKPLNVDKDENEDINSQEPNPKDVQETESQSRLQKSKHELTNDSSISETELGSDESLEEVGSSESIATAKQRKQVSFIPSDKKENVYYMGKTTHSVFQMGETKSQSVFKNLGEKREQSPTSSKTSVFNIKKGRESSLTAVDSVVLVKNKYSLSGRSKTSKELKQSHTSGKPFFNVPQFEIKPILHTEPTVSDLQTKSSRTLNKQQVSEVLKDLSATKLLSVSFPAECCKNNQSVNDFKCLSDLPFSASLHSLPLDEDDLNHITQAVDKLISNEDIVLIPDCDDEWEIQYADTSADEEDKQKWHKAFTARDTDSNILIEIQTDKPVTRKKTAKGQNQKDVQNLPTIKEEDEVTSRKNSLFKDKNANKGLMNKNKSTTSFRSTELRFCTVEYTNFMNKYKISENYCKCRKYKSKAITHGHEHHKHLDRYFKINPRLNDMKNIKDINNRRVKGDYFKSFSILNKSKTTKSRKIDDKLTKKYPKIFNKTGRPSLSPRDEMIMRDIIYLTSNSNTNKSVTSMSSSNDILKLFSDDPELNKSLSYCNFFQDNTKFEIKNSFTTFSGFTKKIKDDGVKEVLKQKRKQNLGENIYTPPKNGCKSYGSLQTIPNNSINKIFENQTYCEANGSTGSFDCSNVECIVTNSELPTTIKCFKTGIEKGKPLCNNLNENVENKIKDNSSWEVSIIENTSKNLDGKTLHNNCKIQYINPNKGSPKTVSNSTKIVTGSNEENVSNNKTNIDFVCCEVKETPESKTEFEVSLSTKFKSVDNFSFKQKVLDGVDRKEQTLQECLTLNYNSKPVESKVSIRRHNLNRRSYFICKKPRVKIVESLDTSTDAICKHHRGKTSTSSNTGTGYKSLKFNINKPRIKFPRITLVVSHDEIPCLEVSPENREITSAEENFGLMKGYINVKNTYNLESETALSTLTRVPQKHKGAYIISHKSNIRITSSIDIEKPSSFTFQTNSCMADPRVSDKKDKSFHPEQVSTFYLFDTNGQPVTDGSGRPLQNMTGETLKLDEAGLPLCDLNNIPILDSSSNTVDEKEFNAVKPPLLDTLKVLTPSGHPMVLYDFAGRPLTSMSGTMLVGSDGKGLLRFGCMGNPVSDFRGKPIFDFRGKQVVETE